MRDSLRQLLLRIGRFQSLLVLTLVYLLLWLPAGLLSRLVADWLGRSAPSRSNWHPRAARVNRPETMREPF